MEHTISGRWESYLYNIDFGTYEITEIDADSVTMTFIYHSNHPTSARDRIEFKGVITMNSSEAYIKAQHGKRGFHISIPFIEDKLPFYLTSVPYDHGVVYLNQEAKDLIRDTVVNTDAPKPDLLDRVKRSHHPQCHVQ